MFNHLPDGIVDAHHHLWGLTAVDYPWLRAVGERRIFGDPTPIQRDYLPGDFAVDWTGLPVVRSVHIQVGTAAGAELAETQWLEQQCVATGLPTGIVAAADLTAPELPARLAAQAGASGALRGVRQIASRRADEDGKAVSPTLLENARFLDGLRLLAEKSLSFDLQLTRPHLAAATRLVERVPTPRVALRHLGWPWDQSPVGLAAWRKDLRAFARLPNTACNLSGFAMFDPQWTRDSLAPVEGVLAAFAPERVMWGSNLPVDKLYRGYGETAEAVAGLVPREHHAQVFAGAARRFYRP